MLLFDDLIKTNWDTIYSQSITFLLIVICTLRYQYILLNYSLVLMFVICF